MIKKSTDKVVFGVIGGIAEHFKTDVRLLRVAAIIFVVVTGFFPGVFIYLIAAFFMKSADEITIHPIREEKK